MKLAEWFNKYLDGSISGEEKHELEKMALDDAFLADAIDGINQYQKSDPQLTRTRLTERFKKAKLLKQPLKIVKLIPYGIAAAISVLLMALWWLGPEQDLSESETVAVTVEPSEAEESELISDDLAREEMIKQKIEQAENIALYQPQTNVDKKETLQDPPIASQEEVIVEHQPVKEDDLAAVEEIDLVRSDNLGINTVVPSAAETLQLNEQADMPDKATSRSPLAISKEMPKQKELSPVNKNPEVQSFRQSQASSPAAIRSAADSSFVMPEMGWIKFRELIDEMSPGKEDFFKRNITLPSPVKLSFVISQVGELTDIRVESSHPYLEERAIAIMEASGTWVPPSGGKRNFYTIYFNPK